jgi:hypothetical protein
MNQFFFTGSITVVCGETGDRVFGGIERDSRKCFLVKVPNKNSDRLSIVQFMYCTITFTNFGLGQKKTYVDNFVLPFDLFHSYQLEFIWRN